MATCLWRSVDDLHKVSKGPEHAKARAATRRMYDEWRFEKFRLVIEEDATGYEFIALPGR